MDRRTLSATTPPHFMQWRGHWVLILVVPLPTHGVSGAKRALPSGFLCAWPPNRVYPGPACVELKAPQERRIQPMVTSHSLINYQRANRDQMPILLASSLACQPRRLCGASHVPSGHR